MDCKECGSRMRIEENTKINEKEYNIVYICTSCGKISSDKITI